MRRPPLASPGHFQPTHTPVGTDPNVDHVSSPASHTLGCLCERAHESDRQQSTQRKLRLDDLHPDGGQDASWDDGARDGRYWPAFNVAACTRRLPDYGHEARVVELEGALVTAETRAVVLLPHGQSDRVQARTRLTPRDVKRLEGASREMPADLADGAVEWNMRSGRRQTN